MRIITQRMTCQCKAVSDIPVLSDAPVNIVAASWKAARCPKCGSDKLRLGGKHAGGPSITAPIQDRIAWWWEHGDTGIGSSTIWCVLTGVPMYRPCYPWDAGDFRRCKMLLDLIPEWRPRLPEVAARYPEWRGLVREWSELERLFEEDAPTGRCLKLYARMQELIEESRA